MTTTGALDRAAAWWRGAGAGGKFVAGLGAGGVLLVGLSLTPEPGTWLRDFLMTVGASLALFSPFYLLTRSLDQHLDRVVHETTRQVEGVRTEAAARLDEARAEAAGQVATLRAEVDERLADTAARVSAALEVQAAADRAAFESLRTDAPTWQTVWAALSRARDLGLVADHRPPRVKVNGTGRCYVAFATDADSWAESPLTLRIEDVGGRQLTEPIVWDFEVDAIEALTAVGRAIYGQTGDHLDAAELLRGLADLLDAAASHPDRRPAVELCPPQWMVCLYGLTTYGGDTPMYGVTNDRVRTAPAIFGHVADKPWVDRDSWEAAYDTGKQLWAVPDPW